MAERITISAKRSKTTKSIYRDLERGIDVLPACNLISQNIIRHLSTPNPSPISLSKGLSGTGWLFSFMGRPQVAVLRRFSIIQQTRNCGLTVRRHPRTLLISPVDATTNKLADIAKIRERSGSLRLGEVERLEKRFYIRVSQRHLTVGSLILQSRVHHLSKSTCLVPIFLSIALISMGALIQGVFKSNIICPSNVIQLPRKRVTTRGFQGLFQQVQWRLWQLE